MEPIARTLDTPNPFAIPGAAGSVPSITEESGAERRREPRFPTDRITALYVTGANKTERTLCRILDYSGSGMRIRTQKPIEPGTEIRVTLREIFAVAKVRYSIPVREGFDHGILVEELRATSPDEASQVTAA